MICNVKQRLNAKAKKRKLKVSLNVDGTGKTKIKTPIGFLDHMLELFAFHGYFDLDLSVTGDTHIDIHHTNEDIGIAWGKPLKKPWEKKKPESSVLVCFCTDGSNCGSLCH